MNKRDRVDLNEEQGEVPNKRRRTKTRDIGEEIGEGGNVVFKGYIDKKPFRKKKTSYAIGKLQQLGPGDIYAREDGDSTTISVERNEEIDENFPLLYGEKDPDTGKWNPRSFHSLVLGDTISGKSEFIRLMFWKNRFFFDQVITFSTVAKYEPTLDFTKPGDVITHYSPAILADILTIAETRFIKWSDGGKKECDRPPYVAILFDDSDTDYNHDEEINLAVTQCRHVFVSLIFSVQYYTMVSPTMRTNTEYLCLRRFRGETNMKETWSMLTAYFQHYRDFIRFLHVHLGMKEGIPKKSPENYTTAVIHMKGYNTMTDISLIRFDLDSIPKFKIPVAKKKKKKKDEAPQEQDLPLRPDPEYWTNLVEQHLISVRNPCGGEDLILDLLDDL